MFQNNYSYAIFSCFYTDYKIDFWVPLTAAKKSDEVGGAERQKKFKRRFRYESIVSFCPVLLGKVAKLPRAVGKLARFCSIISFNYVI